MTPTFLRNQARRFRDIANQPEQRFLRRKLFILAQGDETLAKTAEEERCQDHHPRSRRFFSKATRPSIAIPQPCVSCDWSRSKMTFRLNVLIVEGEPLVMEVLRSILDDDYRVNCATTVAEALAFLRTSVVDLLLLDNLLPDGKGDDVAEMAESLGVAIIRMAGYPSETSFIQKAPCLMKPFGADILLSEVRLSLKSDPTLTGNQR
jgi:CheY-like chemotaxis protein